MAGLVTGPRLHLSSPLLLEMVRILIVLAAASIIRNLPGIVDLIWSSSTRRSTFIAWCISTRCRLSVVSTAEL